MITVFVKGLLKGVTSMLQKSWLILITAQRAFELTSKAVESADQTMQIVNNLKR